MAPHRGSRRQPSPAPNNDLPLSHATRQTLLPGENPTPKQISHLQFGLLSPSDMQRLAEFQVTSRDLFAMPQRSPAPNGVLDPR